METGSKTRTLDHVSNPPKFLFDMDFTEPEVPEIEEPPEPEIPMLPVAEHEELIAAARKEAFEQGKAEGLTEALASQEKRLADAAENLTGVVHQVLAGLEQEQEKQEEDAISLAVLVARRLCSHLMARQPLAETVALVGECLGPLRKAPHVVIRVNEQDVEGLKTKTDPIVYEKGFEGRLVILGEPEIERGDCHIEWADGGIRRDRKTVEQEIDKCIRGYLKSKAEAARAE